MGAFTGAEPRFESVGAGVIPRDVVPTFTQDRQGFLWIASGDGLVRFDGYQFRPQERQSQEPSVRNLGWIRALLAGRDGKVWIGTESSGLAAYDPEVDSVQDYGSHASPASKNHPTTPRATSPAIRALAEDDAGRIYVGTVGGGLEVFDSKAARFSAWLHADQPGALPDDRIQALLIDRQQNLWVGSWAGLARKARGSQQFEAMAAGNPAVQGHIVQALFEASDGRIWIGTQDGLLSVLDPQTGRSTTPAQGQSNVVKGAVSSFTETTDHTVWVGRSDGIQIFDLLGTTLLRQLRHDARRPAGLAGDDVTQLLTDRAGWVWVGGFGLGLQRHNPGNKSIALREADLDAASPFQDPDVRSLLQLANGEIWAATHSGTVVILDSALRARGQLPPLPGQVEAMVQAANANVWLGTDAQIAEMNPQHRLLRQIAHPGGHTRRLFEGKNQTLWVGTQDGVYQLAPGATKLLRLRNADGEPRGEVHAFAEAPDHSLWIGSTTGIYRVPEGSTTVQRVTEVAGRGLSSQIAIGLLFDHQGTLWVDTGVGGLHRMQQWGPQGASFDRISERHGHWGKPFGANLLEDARGRIWTQMGVYDPARDRFVELTPADGANLGTGWFFSYAKRLDGKLLFGGSKGILLVSPEHFAESGYAPPLLLSELHINGERRPLGKLADGIVLASKDRSFSIEFTALDFADPERLEYAYMLEPFDPDWIKTRSSLRLASYSNLDAGSYKLRIRATNRSGVWNPVEQIVSIRVEPAWWQHPWAGVLLAMLVTLLIAAIVTQRTYQLRRSQRELEEKVHARTAELEEMALELQVQQTALEESNVRDPLTGLYNRRFLTQCIDTDIALSVRAHEGRQSYGEPFNGTQDLLFFLFDIDHFKNVNDKHGHLAGDEVLRQFSSRLKAVFRDTDYLIRWGGEEFLGIARQTDRATAAELAERARLAIAREPFVLEDGTAISISCSVGFSCFPLNADQPRALGWVDMVKIADSAMYTVKHFGRNGWVGVMDSASTEPQVLQDWVRRPLSDWIASGLVLHLASESVQREQARAGAGSKAQEDLP